VIGCGGLGLVCISVLRAKGVKNIIACDIDPGKLEAAKQLGAKLTLDTRTPTRSRSSVP
jgi:threonine dehydrogenase-like Zn-dependent dehydrogenase